MSSDRIPKLVYLWESKFQYDWSSELNSIFQSINLTGIVRNGDCCDLSTVRSELERIEINYWDSNRFNKPKLRYYNLYKNTIEPEDYVKNKNLSKYSRSLLAQFRSGILPLEVETGRFRNIPLENRICPMCKIDIEDEFHLLCICKVYENLRRILYNKSRELNSEFETYDDIEKFVFINDNLQGALSKFLYSAMKLRKETLYNYA